MSTFENKMIGIGSYAGIDLIRKIYDLTDAASDQEHHPVAMLSAPHKVGDRTQLILFVCLNSLRYGVLCRKLS